MNPKCGTVAGYSRHRYIGESTCNSCRIAKNKYQQNRKKSYGRCSVLDCDFAVESRNFCPRHLRNFYRYGKADPIKLSFKERFWLKVNLDFNSRLHQELCWLWTGAKTSQGYGKIGVKLAHRVSYELSVAEIPGNLTIDHLCMNRLCVNPNHLEPVTREENSRREMEARLNK